jgi:hypothetical protein
MIGFKYPFPREGRCHTMYDVTKEIYVPHLKNLSNIFILNGFKGETELAADYLV